MRRLGHKRDGDGIAGGEGGVEELGFYCRMNDVAAAIGLAQLERWDAIAARLAAIERRYRAGLEGVDAAEWLRPGPGRRARAGRSASSSPRDAGRRCARACAAAACRPRTA